MKFINKYVTKFAIISQINTRYDAIEGDSTDAVSQIFSSQSLFINSVDHCCFKGISSGWLWLHFGMYICSFLNKFTIYVNIVGKVTVPLKRFLFLLHYNYKWLSCFRMVNCCFKASPIDLPPSFRKKVFFIISRVSVKLIIACLVRLISKNCVCRQNQNG